MKKLGKLEIGGHIYEVSEENLVSPDASRELYGRHEVKENVIYINKDIHESRQQETLIHEIIHAIYFNCGLKHDEQYIDAISNGLFQLGIGEYIWEKIQKKS